MKPMNAFEFAVARVDQFLCGTLPAVYADDAALAVDIVAIGEKYGHLSHWSPQLARARRMLAEKVECERIVREQAKRARHARNLADRRERQRREAAGAGCGKKH